jgi:hypothetical protein
MRFKYFLLALVLAVAFPSVGQNLGMPLDYIISLSGNYAELRKNHFHMGLDFRTDNKENLRILSVEDGYVSRVVVSPNGYGKAIYVHHPQIGLTSIYAHLNAFRPDIEAWLDQVQYALKRNTIDTAFSRPRFDVRKGEHLAFSGNTGSSEGPHLHFEIRNLVTEKTINPLHYYSQIEDTIQPLMSKILFYHYEGESIFIQSFPKEDVQKQTLEINSGSVGIGISAMDKMNNTPNTFGIYAFRVYEDNKLIYQFKLDSLDFRWQSHIKASSDYGLGISDVYKGFFENCSFNLTDSNSKNGIIYLNKGDNKYIRLEVYDFKGNMSSVDFNLTTTADFFADKSRQINCQQEQVLTDQKSFQIMIPSKGLAENYTIEYTLEKLATNEVFKMTVLDSSVAALKPYQLSYFIPKDQVDASKLYLETRGDNKLKTYTGIIQGNALTFPKVKNYGVLIVKYDKKSPIISPELIRKTNKVIFSAKDEESGIGEYQLYIEGLWRKLYYDEKNNQFVYSIIPFDKGKKVRALLEVTDRVGNKNSKTMEILF